MNNDDTKSDSSSDIKYDELTCEKLDVFIRLDQLRNKGIILSQHYTMDSDIETMKYEYNIRIEQLKKEREIKYNNTFHNYLKYILNKESLIECIMNDSATNEEQKQVFINEINELYNIFLEAKQFEKRLEDYKNNSNDLTEIKIKNIEIMEDDIYEAKVAANQKIVNQLRELLASDEIKYPLTSELSYLLKNMFTVNENNCTIL